MTNPTTPVATTDAAQVTGHTPAQSRRVRDFTHLAKIAGLRAQARESFGQVVMAMMNPARATCISRLAA